MKQDSRSTEVADLGFAVARLELETGSISYSPESALRLTIFSPAEYDSPAQSITIWHLEGIKVLKGLLEKGLENHAFALEEWNNPL